MRGVVDRSRYDDEVRRLRDKLAGEEAAHLQEFLAAWVPG
jgi:rubrerythrin